MARLPNRVCPIASAHGSTRLDTRGRRWLRTQHPGPSTEVCTRSGPPLPNPLLLEPGAVRRSQLIGSAAHVHRAQGSIAAGNRDDFCELSLLARYFARRVTRIATNATAAKTTAAMPIFFICSPFLNHKSRYSYGHPSLSNLAISWGSIGWHQAVAVTRPDLRPPASHWAGDYLYAAPHSWQIPQPEACPEPLT
jgi:hypothetical protein